MTVLEGFRVVELGAWVAGPGAGGVLADWGADVIKVEGPGGDPLRWVLGTFAGSGRPDCPAFDMDNRGKRSVVVDLKDGAGREQLLELVATADVFLTNLRPDAVARLGFSPEELVPRYPRLVYARVTGYGSSGPDVDRAGYDVGAFWARSGLAAAAVPPEDPPSGLGAGVGDHVTALALVGGITAALLRRERTGKGQVVDVSLLRTGIYCNSWELALQLRYEHISRPRSRANPTNPLWSSYRAGDGRWFWLLGLESDRHWPNLLRAIGRTDFGDDPRFATARDRRTNAAELVDILDDAFSRLDYQAWIGRFDECGVWWAPVHRAADVVEDPQAIAAGAFVDVPGTAAVPAHRTIAGPVRFSDDPTAPTRGVPALGEHTAEVLGHPDGPA